jgi:hypothetical protein
VITARDLEGSEVYHADGHWTAVRGPNVHNNWRPGSFCTAWAHGEVYVGSGEMRLQWWSPRPAAVRLAEMRFARQFKAR